MRGEYDAKNSKIQIYQQNTKYKARKSPQRFNFPVREVRGGRGGGAHLDKNFQAHVTFPNSIAGLEIVYQRPKGNNKSCFLQPVIYWEFDDQIDSKKIWQMKLIMWTMTIW